MSPPVTVQDLTIHISGESVFASVIVHEDIEGLRPGIAERTENIGLLNNLKRAPAFWTVLSGSHFSLHTERIGNIFYVGQCIHISHKSNQSVILVSKKFSISQKDFAENFASYVQSHFPFFLALI